MAMESVSLLVVFVVSFVEHVVVVVEEVLSATSFDRLEEATTHRLQMATMVVDLIAVLESPS